MSFILGILGGKAFKIGGILLVIAAVVGLFLYSVNSSYDRGAADLQNEVNVDAIQTEQKIRKAGSDARRTPTTSKLRDGSF